jgi:signal transduction histidine kinase
MKMIISFGDEEHGQRMPQLPIEQAGRRERVVGIAASPGLGRGATAKIAACEPADDKSYDLSLHLEALGSLAEGLAHDFNNLLTIIIGNLEQLEARAQDAQLQRQVSTAHQAAKCGERLVKSLLSFAHRQRVACRVLDLNAVIRDMRPLLTHCLGPRVKLVTALDAHLWPVDADASRAEMALLNLAMNARDAMPGGGTLRVATANVMRTGRRGDLEDPFVALTVADTGCGMSPEVLQRAGEPFFTTKPGRGTGLGLAMVHAFVSQFHGTVALDSGLGKGTSVTIYLPCSRSLIGGDL